MDELELLRDELDACLLRIETLEHENCILQERIRELEAEQSERMD